VPLRREHAAPFGRDSVVAAAPLTALFHPAPADPAAAFEAIEHGIERGDMKPQHPGRTAVNLTRDVVPVPGHLLDGSEDHQLGSAFLQVILWRHIWSDNI
jgi:hypothetical protein